VVAQSWAEIFDRPGGSTDGHDVDLVLIIVGRGPTAPKRHPSMPTGFTSTTRPCGNRVNRPRKASRRLKSYRQSSVPEDDLMGPPPRRWRHQPAASLCIPIAVIFSIRTVVSPRSRSSNALTTTMLNCGVARFAPQNQSCHGVEVWEATRRVYCYPDDRPQSTRRTSKPRDE